MNASYQQKIVRNIFLFLALFFLWGLNQLSNGLVIRLGLYITYEVLAVILPLGVNPFEI